MIYERLSQQFAPFLLLMLGILVLAGARVLKADRFLSRIAAGFILTGLGLGLQSLMDNRLLALSSPVVALLYLSGAAATTKGVALRCGESAMRRWPVLGASAICLITISWFAYISENLVVRMIVLNSMLGLIYFSQFPLLRRNWNGLTTWDRLLGATTVVVAQFHFLRGGYVWFNSTFSYDPVVFVQNLTLSLEWKLLLASSSFLSLWFAFLALLCAVQDRIDMMRRESYLDPLTGLLNRRGFFELARARIAARHDLVWVVVAGDLDRFKQINDQWSHSVGDQTLVRTAAMLDGDVRPQDLVARFGGEEFILLLGCRRYQDALTIAEQKREKISLMLVPRLPVRVTMSFGVAALDGFDDHSLDLALEAADRRLYEAKSQGRNRVVSEDSPDYDPRFAFSQKQDSVTYSFGKPICTQSEGREPPAAIFLGTMAAQGR